MIDSVTRLLGSLLLFACLGGCAAAVIGGAAAGGYYAAKSNRPAGTMTKDARITSSINTRYVQDSLVNALDVSVETYRGTVTLYGSLPSQEAVQRAVAIARSVTGVTRVISQLTVVPK